MERRARAGARLVQLLVVACALAASSACTQATVAHTEGSIDDLVRAVLDAIERRDVDALRQLALNEHEFRTVVYPELPAARPERNLSFDYVWNDLKTKSDHSLAGIVEKYAGTPLTIVRVSFEDGVSQYPSYVVHRQCRLVVRNAEGLEEEVRLFGSVFEQDGRFKVFSYNVD